MEHVHAERVQPGGDLAGTAADVRDRSVHLFGEQPERRPQVRQASQEVAGCR
jgi:hypothetical protein